MLDQLKDINLLHHLALRALFPDLVFVCGLYGDQLASEAMQAKIDLAKGAFAEDLANSVELDAGLWHLVVFFEAVRDDFGEESDLT